MVDGDVRRWVERFATVADVDRAQRCAAPPDGAWALHVSLPLIDAARSALARAPALSARRAEEDARLLTVWHRLRAPRRP